MRPMPRRNDFYTPRTTIANAADTTVFTATPADLNRQEASQSQTAETATAAAAGEGEGKRGTAQQERR
jgi:hypothetical protein